jgi:threonine dehydratase
MKADEYPDLKKAAELLDGQIHRSPMLRSQTIDRALGCEVHFKSEHLQKTGSFKVRGACYTLHSMTAEERSKGVITHSSGNHGQALAWAGKALDTKVHVVVPEDAPKVKVEAMHTYGAQLHFCAPGQAAREQLCSELMDAHGFSFVSPYDDPLIITGQSTMMQECIEDISGLDAAFVPVGGGGLLAGALLAARQLQPDLKVFGAEPRNADDAFRSLESGVRQEQPAPKTIADGLRTALGIHNFAIIQQEAEGIVTVTEEEILEAMKWIYRYLKQAIEPSAAVSLAAIIKEKDRWKGRKLLSVLCGGNSDLSSLPF